MATTRNHNLMARVGQNFVIRFQVKPALGGRWTVTTRPCPLIRHRAEKATYDGTRPAAPVAQAFEFQAVRPGRTTIEICRVDEGGRVQEREIYAITVAQDEPRRSSPQGGRVSVLPARPAHRTVFPMALAAAS